MPFSVQIFTTDYFAFHIAEHSHMMTSTQPSVRARQSITTLLDAAYYNHSILVRSSPK